MDKYQRRQLRKRDEKLGKLNEAYLLGRGETENRKKIEVFATLRDYTGNVIPNFVAFCLKFEQEHRVRELEWMWNIHNGFNRWGFRYMWWGQQSRSTSMFDAAYHITRDNHVLDYDFSWGHTHRESVWAFRTIDSGRIWALKDFMCTPSRILLDSCVTEYEDYIGGKRVLVYRGNSIDVRASISNGKRLIDKRLSKVRAYELLRAKKRTQKFRNELIAECNRLRPILNFKHIKEELMMAAWHPKRIERILELGGWEALDNFAGC